MDIYSILHEIQSHHKAGSPKSGAVAKFARNEGENTWWRQRTRANVKFQELCGVRYETFPHKKGRFRFEISERSQWRDNLHQCRTNPYI